MKAVKMIIILVISLFLQEYTVHAKDTIHSINKYSEENLTFIKSSYNKKNKKDGLIVGGRVLKETFEKENETYNDYQILIVKYKKTGEIAWTFTYGKTTEDNIDALEYTYNENNEIDGYLVVLERSYDIDTTQGPEDNTATFLKIDLEGNLLWEKSSSSEVNKITKIIPTWSEEKIIDGYIAIGYSIEDTKKKKAYIINYDKELNTLWDEVYEVPAEEEVEYQDITLIQETQRIIGYALIKSTRNDDSKEAKKELIWFNSETREKVVIDDSLEKYQSSSLEQANNGFILYGTTSDVKLKKGSQSYYLINYNSNKEVAWETIGEEAVKKEKKIFLLPTVQGLIEEYILLYENDIDDSKEVVKIDTNGNIQKKIKKIKNDYYNFENFYIENNTLYFVGQINCPEDDNCEYDKNSLFLISDEDTVIEVKDDDSKQIIIILGSLITIIGIVILKKRFYHKTQK